MSTETDFYPTSEPTMRLHATYGAVPWGCPETVTLDLYASADGLTAAVYAAVDAVARVPGSAQHAQDQAARVSMTLR